MENLSKLSNEVLTRRLQKFSDELEESKEVQGYVLRQSGMHIPASIVKKFEAETLNLTKSIGNLKAELEQRK